MLEDESGRIRLIGKILEETPLVTGVIVGVLGVETSGGDFEVIDICFSGMAPQVGEDDRMDIDGEHGRSGRNDGISLLTGYLKTFPPGHLQALTMAPGTNT
jgi:DNA polymerase delta subunit 2